MNGEKVASRDRGQPGGDNMGMSDNGKRNIENTELIPARMLNEYAYCPRLCYIEWIQGEFENSVDTVEGRHIHRRVDRASGKIMEGKEDEDEKPINARSVHLSTEKVGITCRMDLIEGTGNVVTPVDYKKGRTPDIEEGAWEADRVQLCAQALVLRDNGFECESGVIYYAASKKRVVIPIDDDLVEKTLAYIREMREMAESKKMPLPLVDSPKCPRCSMVGICLPDEVNFLSGKTDEKGITRKLIPPLDKGMPVYVVGQGNKIRKKGDELLISSYKEKIASARIREISQLSLYGGVEITTPALGELLQRGIPVCFFSHGGWFYGIAQGHTHKNVELRMFQYRIAGDTGESLAIARQFIHGKIRNCRTLLRRNDSNVPKNILDRLSHLANDAQQANAAQNLLGMEGAAAQAYFSRFNDLLKSDQCEFQFDNRNKRPPRDPVNSVLSYLYAVLVKELFVTLLSVGFDPYLGFFHRPRYGRPALALDLMEEFRPIVADSVAITLFNTGEIQKKDFIRTGAGVTITPEGRRKVLGAYERRMSDEITHPIFGYTVTYRRVLNIQARLLSRVLSKEISGYTPFCTR